MQGERPSALTDLPVEWIVKITVPIGFLLLLSSGFCVVVRNLLFLLGRELTPAPHPDASLLVQAVTDPRPGRDPA